MAIPMGPPGMPWPGDDPDDELAGLRRRLAARGYRMAAFTQDQLLELLSWHAECGPYCAGDEHCDLAWIAVEDDHILPDDELAARLRVAYRETFGCEYLRHQFLPETPREPEHLRRTTTAMDRNGDLAITEGTPEEARGLVQRAYRVWFAVPAPIEFLRAKFLPPNFETTPRPW